MGEGFDEGVKMYKQCRRMSEELYEDGIKPNDID